MRRSQQKAVALGGSWLPNSLVDRNTEEKKIAQQPICTKHKHKEDLQQRLKFTCEDKMLLISNYHLKRRGTMSKMFKNCSFAGRLTLLTTPSNMVLRGQFSLLGN